MTEDSRRAVGDRIEVEHNQALAEQREVEAEPAALEREAKSDASRTAQRLPLRTSTSAFR
jgi:hypothetical protein